MSHEHWQRAVTNAQHDRDVQRARAERAEANLATTESERKLLADQLYNSEQEELRLEARLTFAEADNRALAHCLRLCASALWPFACAAERGVTWDDSRPQCRRARDEYEEAREVLRAHDANKAQAVKGGDANAADVRTPGLVASPADSTSAKGEPETIAEAHHRASREFRALSPEQQRQRMREAGICDEQQCDGADLQEAIACFRDYQIEGDRTLRDILIRISYAAEARTIELEKLRAQWKDWRTCSCGQAWKPAAGLYGTTEENECQACVLRRLLSEVESNAAGLRAKLARYEAAAIIAIDTALAEVRRQGGADYVLTEARTEGLAALRALTDSPVGVAATAMGADSKGGDADAKDSRNPCSGNDRDDRLNLGHVASPADSTSAKGETGASTGAVADSGGSLCAKCGAAIGYCRNGCMRDRERAVSDAGSTIRAALKGLAKFARGYDLDNIRKDALDTAGICWKAPGEMTPWCGCDSGGSGAAHREVNRTSFQPAETAGADSSTPEPAGDSECNHKPISHKQLELTLCGKCGVSLGFKCSACGGSFYGEVSLTECPECGCCGDVRPR